MNSNNPSQKPRIFGVFYCLEFAKIVKLFVKLTACNARFSEKTLI